MGPHIRLLAQVLHSDSSYLQVVSEERSAVGLSFGAVGTGALYSLLSCFNN